MYKLRIYADNGNTENELFFFDIWELIDAYKQEISRRRPYSLRPTAWVKIDDFGGDDHDNYKRLMGF